MGTYSEQFKDPRWQKKRPKILERDNFTCQECGSKKHTLHIHHKYYENNKKVWEYLDTALITLCENCHKLEQSIKKENESTLIKSLYDLGFTSSNISGIAGGFSKLKIPKDEDLTNVAYDIYKILINYKVVMSIIKKHLKKGVYHR